MTVDHVEKNIKKRKCSKDFFIVWFDLNNYSRSWENIMCFSVVKLNKLKSHFDSKYLSFAGKDTNYFWSKDDWLKKTKLNTGGRYHKQNVVAVEASYVVALRLVRAVNCHTIGEDLLLPVAKDIVRVIIGDEFVTQLSVISLFNDTVYWRIDGMSADITWSGNSGN